MLPEDEEDEEAPEEFERDVSKLKYVNGLPKRNVKDMVRNRFHVTFTKFDEAALPKLTLRARKLLGLE